MGAAVALRAVAFQLAMRVGVALLAVSFQLAMRTRVALHADGFLRLTVWAAFHFQLDASEFESGHSARVYRLMQRLAL
jgi:hypothetical protein